MLPLTSVTLEGLRFLTYKVGKVPTSEECSTLEDACGLLDERQPGTVTALSASLSSSYLFSCCWLWEMDHPLCPYVIVYWLVFTVPHVKRTASCTGSKSPTAKLHP